MNDARDNKINDAISRLMDAMDELYSVGLTLSEVRAIAEAALGEEPSDC